MHGGYFKLFAGDPDSGSVTGRIDCRWHLFVWICLTNCGVIYVMYVNATGSIWSPNTAGC